MTSKSSLSATKTKSGHSSKDMEKNENKKVEVRYEQGRQMNGLVKRIGETSYAVSSQSGNGSYDVHDDY
jgi:hypothetical protein